MVRLYTITTILFLSQNVFAQEIEKLGEDDLYKNINIYEQKVISASRSEQKVSDLPITIFIVSKEQIQKNAYKSLVDVLQDVPSVKTSRVGNGQEGETFLLRGLRGNYYVKILLNGIPINPTTTLGMPIGEQLPIQQAERIEIITGATSAIYGADALAGVINIITQNPDDNTNIQAGITTGNKGYNHAHFLVGSNWLPKESMKQSVQYSIYGNFSKQNDLNLPRTASLWNPNHYNSDFATSIPTYTPYYKGSNIFPKLENMPRTSYLYGISLQYAGLELTYNEMYRREHSSLGQSTASYFYYNPEVFFGEKIRRTSLVWNKTIKNTTLVTNISWLNYRLDKQSSFALTFEGGDKGRQYKYAASDDLLIEQLATFKIREKLQLTTGVYYQISGNLPKTNDLPEPIDEKTYKPFARSIKLSDTLFGKFGYNPIVFDNIAGFVQGYYNTEKISMIGGIRYDYQSIYGESLNPRLAFLYKISPKSSIRLSVGTAFKAPTTNNSYNSVAIPAGNGQILYLSVPSPDLSPEKSVNYEIGYRHQFAENISLELIAFQNKINGLMESQIGVLDKNLYPLGVGNTVNMFINDPNAFALLRGIQANFRIQNISQSRVSSDVFIKYSRGKEELPNKEGIINTFREEPDWMVQWNISFEPSKKIYIHLRNSWMSSFYTKDVFTQTDFTNPKNKISSFYVAHLTLGYNINKNLYTNIRINNLLNTEYAGIGAYGGGDLLYNPQSMRMVQIGVNFLFK
ncbi:hypothetical protein AD998_05580 [bacterium 336/3]|nr:hypothetical protein AD998_05580 [bacterium 336/3]